jgi:hypothetical protein
MCKSAGRAPSLRALPYNLGKSTKNPQSGQEKPQSVYSIHITKTPTHYKIHTCTHTHQHITKQYKTTTIQIKTNTVQDIPK